MTVFDLKNKKKSVPGPEVVTNIFGDSIDCGAFYQAFNVALH